MSWLNFNNGDAFRVLVSDSVSDGCWSNPSASKNSVQLELKRSGFQLAADDDYLAKTVLLNGVGYQVSDSACVASYSVSVLVPSVDSFKSNDHRLLSFTTTVIWRNTGVMNGPKANSNTRLKTAMTELIQSFLVDIEENKRDVIGVVRDIAEDNEKQFWTTFEVN